MSDIDPLAIFMTVIRLIMAIMVIVILIAFFSFFSQTIVSDDLQRFTYDISETIMSSNLTEERYVFNSDNLDSMLEDQNDEKRFELPSARSCSFGYYATIEDIKDGKKWEFGYKASRSRLPIAEKRLEFRASINVSGERDENFYQSVKPAMLTVTAYDTWFVRLTCAVEKAYIMKEVRNITMRSCIEPSLGIPPDQVPCFSLKRDDKLACYFYEGLALGGGEENIDCRFMPEEIRFERFYETTSSLRDRVDISKPLRFLFYPIRDDAGVPSCDTIKQDPGTYVAADDSVQTVLICLENQE